MNFNILGLMSGSSLDGVDMALISFSIDEIIRVRDWKILSAQTIPFEDQLARRLAGSTKLNGKELWQLHIDFGHYLGNLIRHFADESNHSIDYVASHGHTVFHYPDAHMTCQIGDGAAMSAISGLPVMVDFRGGDMALGGQGAPLAPLADRVLFPSYDCFLNLGGIANLNIPHKDNPIAFDICPFNQAFDFFAQKLNRQFDNEGQLARTGKVQAELLDFLFQWSFIKLPFPKSLDNTTVRQWIDEIDNFTKYSIQDILATLTAFFSQVIAESFNSNISENSKLLVTGGGAYNTYFIEKLNNKLDTKIDVTIPPDDIINFKEAALMSVAGLYRLHNKAIFDHRRTGATRSVSGGSLYNNG